MPRPKHHYVPRFYLKRFSEPQGKIKAYDRTKGMTLSTSITNLATETEYYSVLDEQGEKSDVVEELLSRVEGRAKEILDSHSLHNSSLSSSDRLDLSLLIGLQLVRTPKWRFDFNDSEDYRQRMFLEINMAGKSKEGITKFLESFYERSVCDDEVETHIKIVRNIENERFYPTGNQVIATMLQMSLVAAKLILYKPWVLYTRKTRDFITCDQPVIPWRDSLPEFGVGISTADETLFPIDPYSVLAVKATDLGEERSLSVQECDDATVVRINQVVAHSSLRWVYFHPRHKDAMRYLHLPRSAAIKKVNQYSIHHGESSWNALREEWMPAIQRVNAERSRRANGE